MTLKTDEIKKIAHLARLAPEIALTGDFTSRLQRVLGLIAKIDAIDISDVEPLAHPLELIQPLREDKVTEKDESDKFLKLAPKESNHLYLVPKVIE